jgi:glycosyltransferase involved in cell wall biosynthesis
LLIYMSAESSLRKVLHIIHGFGPGGVETWLLEAVKYLQAHPELNLRFDFLLTGGVPGIFDEEIKKCGSNIYYIRYSNSSILSFRRNFRIVLKNNTYTAIHNHEDFISGWHYLLGRKYLPSVRIAHLHNPYNFVHNYVVNPLRWVSFKAGRKLMARYATKITGTSNAVMDEYGYNKDVFRQLRTAPAYCGFDTAKFLFDPSAKKKLCHELNWNEDVKIALFVGRIGLQHYDTAANQKNPSFAFEVAKQLVTKYGRWCFVFVGYKGEAGREMEEAAIEKGLSERIKFLDIRRDVPKIMSASDVFVFPSLWEGLGMVAVEAQCSGLKVIISDTVPKEAVVSESLVTIKNLGDGADAWAETIAASKGIADRAKYVEQIRNSPFSIQNSVDRLMRLYES